jgi:hypothetical protein
VHRVRHSSGYTSAESGLEGESCWKSIAVTWRTRSAATIHGVDKQRIVAFYRLIFALLTLVAIGYQAYHLHDVGVFKPFNFFSFFTIQNNLLAAALFLYLATRPSAGTSSPTLDYVRGAVALYMTLVGIVYGLLLSGYTAELQTAVIWVDNVVHRIMPLVMFADWLIDPPQAGLEFRQTLRWLTYPLVYVVYTLIRGPIVDWYPYPFLDPDQAGGYPGVFAYSVGITIGVVIFIWIVVAVGNRRRAVAMPTGT